MESSAVDSPAEGMSGSLERFRQYYETVKQWTARKQFLSRNMHLYPGNRIEQLNALSVVWSNIVFMRCRYGEQLTEKVHQMADGIDIGDSERSFTLVPNAMTTKRKSNSDAGEQPAVKKFGLQPRFQPIHFVVSTSVEDQSFKKTGKQIDTPSNEIPLGDTETPDRILEESSVFVSTSDHSDQEETSEMELNSTPYIYDPNTSAVQNKCDSDTFMIQTERDYSAKFESHHSDLSKGFRSNVLDMWKGIKNQKGRKGIGFVQPLKKSDTVVEDKKGVSSPLSGPKILSSEKSSFIIKLSDIVKNRMINPTKTSDSQINFTHMLTLSAQACKTNPEYIYVPVKDIPPENFPQRRVPCYGFACEVRCQGVYLATGYSFGKHGARNQAAELAIKLLQNNTIKVVAVKRKSGHVFCDDVVACANEAQLNELPPALQQNYTPVLEVPSSTETTKSQPSHNTQGALTKPWSEFFLSESACDPVRVLDKSAAFNNMKVEYLHERIIHSTWRCRVFVQGHCIAEASGRKKKSKLCAAEKAVNILKGMPINEPKTCDTKAITSNNNPTNKLKDILVYQNNHNAISVLNDTAQFNKVAIEYVFEKPSETIHHCKIFMAQQFLAEAFGEKKTVKLEAAEAAVTMLKSTQPVINNYTWESSDKDAITVNQIREGGDVALKQKIKDDNIGNQLLRKMGWSGGGLGKTGEGITEPITVKEQYKREGLGVIDRDQRITKKDIEKMIRNYVSSCNQDDLKFSQELSKEERKYIHMIASRYGLKTHSHGKDNDRFLVVSRKLNKEVLLDQLREKGQVGRYALAKP